MKKIIIFLLVFIVKFSFSQTEIGGWKTHLPYSSGQTLEIAGSKIYCVATQGLFYYDYKDNSTHTISKEDGLSDVTISSILYVKEKDALIIGYENGNIDILKGNTITNISDIKRKQIYGSKSINNILSYNNSVYLATGFGIINLDIDKYEIKDTYLIGQNSQNKQIFDLIVFNDLFYAATEDGIFTADVNSPNLAFYENWVQDLNIENPNNKFKGLTIFNNKIYVIQDNDYIDKIFYTESNNWIEFVIDGANYYTSINSDEQYLYLVHDWKASIIDLSSNETVISSYNFPWGTVNTGISYVLQHNGKYYFSDYKYGIVEKSNNNSTTIKPNGPYSTSFWNIDILNGKLYASMGGVNASWNNLHTPPYIMWYIDNWWDETKLESNYAKDILAVVIDKKDDNRVYYSSWNGGVFELYNNKQVNHWDENNSTLGTVTSTWPMVRVGGLDMDEDGNLWTCGPSIGNTINVKTPSNKWYGLPYNISAISRTIMITQDNFKWVNLHRSGIFVFNDKGTFGDITDDDTKTIQILDENGEIVSNDVFSMAEDKDGTIWLGTSKGVVTYFYPSDVFTNDNFRGQRVIIEQNGISQYLLETEEILAIAVDGANRKWFGTRASGVYLISEDGTKELKHFTEENSPLLSNDIRAIKINDITGEVYFGTSKGLISYRGTATEGNEEFADVYAYPNPVRPEYNGVIAIKGLVENADVKITDISGNIVFETKAEGGQAIWNGKNFNGEKVSTGVYLAFCSNEDGSKTHITKILFIN